MREGVIVATNPGGIANRIKCLVSMWRGSEIYNKKLCLYWKKNHTCGANFQDLFENEIEEIDSEKLDKITKSEIVFYGGDEEELKNSSKKYILSDTWRFLLLPGEIPENFARAYPSKKGKNIDFEFERIPKETRKIILQFLDKLIPVESVRKEVTDFQKKYPLQNMIGVHVRRGDFLDGKEGLGKVSSDALFFSKMKEKLKESPNIKFFLCTDCQNTEEKYLKEFKDKIVLFPKTNRDRTSVIATKEGLVDLLLLSKTNEIIGTYFSTFTELAWWLGGCNAKVSIIKDEMLKSDYEMKKKRLENQVYLKLKRYLWKLFKGRNKFS